MKPSVTLIPLSAVYSAVTRTRLVAYRRGWLSVSKLDAPVISVGNLTTGGTGKTPLVEWVCRVLASGDAREDSGRKKVCVLTRGYGRANPRTQVVVSNGAELLADVQQAGDEPLLLAKNLIGVAAVVANSDRAAAGEWAARNLNAQCFVLDDGFQHLGLARDLDIVIIDATNPWGGGSLLPAGHLREPLAGLSRAGCVVITRVDQVQDVASIKEAVAQQAGPIPVFSSRMVTSGFRNLTGEAVDKDNLKSQDLGAFCGVGNPHSFFKHLRQEGLTPAFTRTSADHYQYEQPDIDSLVHEAKAAGVKGLITTAKDATKLSALNLALPCYVLEIRISIDEEDRMVDMIRAACQSWQR